MRRGGHRFGAPQQPHRPQMNIPRQLQPPMQQPHFNGGNSGGPLMTDHLQGLKDIDMELELLKRKREIIEQQQQILSNSSYRQRNDYDDSYGQAHESRFNDNYTDLYDEPRDTYGRGEARKRVHSVPVWESSAPVPPKRFSGPTRGGKSFNSRFESAPRPEPRFNSRPAPRLEPRPAPRVELRPAPRPEPRPAPKPYKRPAPPPRKLQPSKPRKEFQPSKVSKASGPPAPLARYEPAERKRLVAEAKEQTGPPKEPADFWLLRADRAPHVKLNGRLELALGAIMKEVRAANPQHAELFRAQLPMRAMKAAVRDRIRNVMIGKLVTTIDHTKAAYYEKYPCHKHDYIVMQGLEVFQDKGKEGKILVMDADNAESFFKKNMQYLMHRKMDEMINQLQTLYSQGLPLPLSRIYMRPKSIQTDPTNSTNQETEIKANESEITDKAESDDKEKTKANTQETNETHATENESKQDATEAEVEEKAAEETPKEVENPKELTEEEKAARDITLKFIDDDMYKALDKLMTFKILHLLKTYTPEMIKIMDLNKMYRQTKHEILSKTKAMLLNKPIAENDAASENAQSTPAKTPQKKGQAQYYVKIMGRPALPKRKAMEAFFAEYQPRTIKKHKTVHNLLFVGFADKESYDKIQGADGTVIGRYTLDIKISERNTRPNNSQNTSIVTIDDDEDKANDSTEIGSDLDTQITDLLTSIRQSEFETADEDIVMTEPNDEPDKPTEESNKVIDEEVKGGEEVIDCDTENTEEKDQEGDDDVVQFEDVPQNNDGETQNETEDQNNDVAEVKDGEQPENDDIENREDKAETVEVSEDAEANDAVAELKTAAKEVPKTPTRASARLATPSTIKTRRMSKLAE